MSVQEERTALYRFFNQSGRLLYVGVTRDPGQRLGKHGTTKSWWESVSVMRTQWYPSRQAALDAEYEAITTEAPLHNVVFRNHARPSGDIEISGRVTLSRAGDEIVGVIESLTRNVALRSRPHKYETPAFSIDFLVQYFPLCHRRSLRRSLEWLTRDGRLVECEGACYRLPVDHRQQVSTS